MNTNHFFIPQTGSTNDYLRQMLNETNLPEFTVVQSDFQNAGKGQRGNMWESERGKNLLFSILLKPANISASEQFLISQIVSLAIKNTLDEFADGFTIKWSNDIYFNDKKICGILIENDLNGNKIKQSIAGIGLNINQIDFPKNLPNPLSLQMITGKNFSLTEICENIVENLKKLYLANNKLEIKKQYFNNLYRKNGFFPFQADNETFSAKILDVKADGKLVLETNEGEQREFYFKEVKFL
ncbi:MAG: biotin--[acetyl-CoA-carboxylase] ligase [Paludibacter sp.]|jgi:BirA family biotin operon repressor/biotin-[acetyl-CoA-carboxylase] ligase|nr:biotin--[acetyl-CoA-carboxylase] ligase [Paludibacter sp.]